MICNLRDGFIGLSQQPFSCFDFLCSDIFTDGHSGIFYKQLGSIGLTDMCLFHDLGRSEGLM